MLSQTVEYALRSVVHLAHHVDTPQTTAQIAVATKVPLAYLSKVLQSLQRNQLVKTQRGVGGGIQLNVSPDSLTILDVVNAVDPIIRIDSCPLSLRAHGKRLCELHRRIDNALQATETAFAATTLAELLREPNPSRALCDTVE
jgi:Rrf2 family protein